MLLINLNDRRQCDHLVKAIPQSVVVMFYNLCQSNVNPTLPPLLVTGHNITDLRRPDITIPHTSVKELDPFSSNTISILQFLDFKI